MHMRVVHATTLLRTARLRSLCFACCCIFCSLFFALASTLCVVLVWVALRLGAASEAVVPLDEGQDWYGQALHMLADVAAMVERHEQERSALTRKTRARVILPNA